MVRNGTGGRRHLISLSDEALALRKSLRQEMRLKRRALAPVRRQLATRAILRHLLALPTYRRARHIALYWPADGEPDLRSIASHARRRGKQLYLPVVAHGGAMRFAAWPRDAQLRRNRYGIPEPLGGRKTVTAARLDLVLMPLVAFDAHGSRLGMGGGYYDRALASRGLRPSLVGIAFSFQQAPELPVQPWDVPLDMVITERGRLVTRNARGKARLAKEEAGQ
jgi:5-formyltetrahydrofolate cyclo-ligase